MNTTLEPPPDYAAFLDRKSQLGGEHGFAPVWMPDWLHGFQRFLTDWSIRKGRAATYADCGMGKTPMQLVAAENFVRQANRPVLIAAPLSVAAQTVREAEKFGIDAVLSRDGTFTGKRVVVTNYERLHYFRPDDFAAFLGDEFSCIKDFAGRRRRDVTEFMRTLRWRQGYSATPAPNDFTEFGTTSEALGELGHMDMLARFFKNDDKTIHLHGQKYGDLTAKKWRFKPHAEPFFWRWLCSWSRACRRPSDLGFPDDGYVLPELITREHEVKASRPAPGRLFDVAAVTLDEQREEAKRTIPERCAKVAELLAHDRPAVAWCFLDDEADLLEELIPGAVQVSGRDRDEVKEERFAAFTTGQIRVLITKPKIGGWGLNWQHCAHMTFFPTHSFEAFYQCVRRCWRYGQVNPVTADMVTTDGSAGVLANQRRKAAAAERMYENVVVNMNAALRIGRAGYGDKPEEVPSWL
jgi:hypothetical protein